MILWLKKAGLTAGWLMIAPVWRMKRAKLSQKLYIETRTSSKKISVNPRRKVVQILTDSVCVTMDPWYQGTKSKHYYKAVHLT